MGVVRKFHYKSAGRKVNIDAKTLEDLILDADCKWKSTIQKWKVSKKLPRIEESFYKEASAWISMNVPAIMLYWGGYRELIFEHKTNRHVSKIKQRFYEKWLAIETKLSDAVGAPYEIKKKGI